MALLIHSARISDPESKHHGLVRDLLIEKGEISQIKANIPLGKHQVIDAKNLHVSPGWMDMGANFCDPGYEYKEDLTSGMAAASRGGYTAVVSMPTTNPPIDSRAHVDYLLKQSAGRVTELFPTGTISKGLKGEHLSELHDMSNAGAVAFTDYKTPDLNPELLNRALEYSKGFNGLILAFPHDSTISPGGCMNESAASVGLGLKGIPSITEEVCLMRDIELARYTGGKLHVILISSARSVDLIRQAKKSGINISCGVAAHQLSFLDTDLVEFDTRLKVLPPFRKEKDRKAIVKGLQDGTIDVVISDHSPEDVENKKREFEHAAYGISGIESAFLSFATAMGNTDPDQITKLFAINPRNILGLKCPSIEEKNKVNITLFQLNVENIWSTKDMVSKSKNSPFNSAEFTAKVVGVVRGSKSEFN